MKVVIAEWEWQRVAAHLREAGAAKQTIDIVKDAFRIQRRPKWQNRPVDEALKSHVAVLARLGLSQREIAARVGRGKGTVQYVLRLLQ